MKRSLLRVGLIACAGVALAIWVHRGLRANAAPHLPTPRLTLGAYASPRTVADAARWQAFLLRSDTTGLNTVVLDLVTPAGIHFRSGSRLGRAVGAPPSLSYDLADRVAGAHARHLFVIGRLDIARNPRLARERPRWTIRTPSGRRWTDASNRTAIDVTNEDACEFVAKIAQEAARAGVDEVMLDNLEIPFAPPGSARLVESRRQGVADHIAVTRCARIVAGSVRRARARVGIAVPARLCTDVARTGLNGQRWEDLALVADRMHPEVYPSATRGAGGRRMTDQPYQAVSGAIGMCYARTLRLIRLQNGEPVRVARLEPWVQAYSPGYGPLELGEELRALREHGVGNALLWNGESDFDRFVPALRQPPARVVAYNPTPAQWARANQAPGPAKD